MKHMLYDYLLLLLLLCDLDKLYSYFRLRYR